MRQPATAKPGLALKRALHAKTQPYLCPELARNPGIPDGRMRAFTLPSRVGKRLIYPDGRVEEISV